MPFFIIFVQKLEQQMTKKEFLCASRNLKEFIKEQNKIGAAIKLISPSFFCEFGDKFIEDYIKVVEIALGDECNAFSWFVFENDFGKKKMEVKIDGKEYKICNENQFFDLCVNR